MKSILFFPFFIICFFCSCAVSKQLDRSAKKTVLTDSALQTAHVGISIFDPATNKYWYNHQGDKYFIPASNTKIATCYAAMKYLGKNLPGIRYEIIGDDIIIQPTGDPTFLHPDYSRQRVYDFLKNIDKRLTLDISQWNETAWGSGWAWNDYPAYYMAERSAMPIYGNVLRISGAAKSLTVAPQFFSGNVAEDSGQAAGSYPASVRRGIADNRFLVKSGAQKKAAIETPFYTNNSDIIYLLLQDALHKSVARSTTKDIMEKKKAVIHSQLTDSMLKPMMHRSDNFFAEQTLLMVSNELLGVMNDAKIIDTLLKTDFKDLPQRPRWADGSGLSRYNLFTPQDFVAILNKMKNEFGMDRIKEVFPTGNTGTLTNYYKSDSAFLFAKTGTLSSVVAVSGFMYTRKNKLLLFSVLVNNHQASATAVRRAVEKFLQGLRERY